MSQVILKIDEDSYYADNLTTCPVYLKKQHSLELPYLESEKLYEYIRKCAIEYIGDENTLVKPITSNNGAYDIFTANRPIESVIQEAIFFNKPTITYVSFSKFKLFKSTYMPGIKVFYVKNLTKYLITKVTPELFDYEREYFKPEMLYDVCKYCKYNSQCNGF